MSICKKVDILLEDSPEVYYWIGYLFADGTIDKFYNIQLSCGLKDKQQLIKFSKFIKWNLAKIFYKEQKCAA